MQRATIANHAHGLGHLKRADENVALANGQIGNVAALECAFVNAEHVLVVRNVAGGFRAQRDASAAAEANSFGIIDNRCGAHFESRLIEPRVAGLSEGLFEI